MTPERQRIVEKDINQLLSQLKSGQERFGIILEKNISTNPPLAEASHRVGSIPGRRPQRGQGDQRRVRLHPGGPRLGPAAGDSA